VAFANPRRSHKKHVPLLAHELAGGQLVDLATVTRGVEGEVEVLQGTRLPEAGHLVAAHDQTLVTHVELVLESPQRFFVCLNPGHLGAIPQVSFGPESGCGWESIKKLPKFSRNAMFT
jgi:hypothetical protein